MTKDLLKRNFSILFLFVFFTKTMLTIAPLIAAHFDRQTVNAVIMQLEIENNAKSNDLKENSSKEYFSLSNFRITLAHPTQIILPSMINADHDKHIQAFYPPVPTPPPNV